MNIIRHLKLGIGFTLGISAAHAASVNLNTWTPESYPAVSGFGAGVWTVSGAGNTVLQSVNGQPTMFVSDFNAQGTTVSGKIRVGTDDDDFMGFVLGFNAGDSTNASADYLLVDWKQTSQNFDFGAPSSSPGGNAPAGLAVSRVTGIPDADEFWQHANLNGTLPASGLNELARGLTRGNIGWVDNAEYTFTFEFGPNNLRVFVDNTLEIDIAGSFKDGRMGFYNFSQAGVTYSAFTVDQGPFPPPDGRVPDAGSSIILLGFGLAGLAALRRRISLAA